MKSPKIDQLPLRFPETDSLSRISRGTLNSLAQILGVNETQAVHLALRRLAEALLPGYEQDNGPLTDEQLETIRSLEPQEIGEPLSSL